MLNDWRNGVTYEIPVRCDSSAARGMSARQGLEQSRHVDVRFLRLQQAVHEGRLTVQYPDEREHVRHIHEVPIHS